MKPINGLILPALPRVPVRGNGAPDADRNVPIRVDKGETFDAAKRRLKQAAQEFEALITFQMLKTMRSTIGEADKGGFLSGYGKETFTDLFDMELSKKLSDGNDKSLSAVLYRSLEKTLAKQHGLADDTHARFGPLPIKTEKPALSVDKANMFPLGSTPAPVTRPVKNGMPHMPSNRIAMAVESSLPTVPTNLKVTTARRVESTSELGDDVRMIRSGTGHPVNSPVSDVDTQPDSANKSRKRNSIDFIIEAAAHRHDLDSALIRSVISVESAGDPDAISHAGAKGLMQLMDSTATELGVTDVFDPHENVNAGAAYLKRMLNRFGDLRVALAAYNAGPGNVRKYDGIPPFRETEAYVEKVMSRYERLRAQGEEAPAPKVHSTNADTAKK